ncbi:MAG: hypothetical protein ABIP39_00045 [Polyangiaceae bacterium]
MKTFFPVALLAALGACSSTTTNSATPPIADGGAADATTFACDTPDTPLTVTRSPLSITPVRDHHVTFVYESKAGPYLYVMGGAQNDFSDVWDDVQRSKIAADGSLGPFETISHITGGLAGAALGIIGNTVILAGGTAMRPGFLDTTKLVSIGDDGMLGAWRDGPSLPDSVMHAAAVVDKKNFYVFGGTTGSAASTMAARATLGDDGTLSPFTNVTALSPARSHMAAFVFNRGIYLVGGLTESPQGNPPSRKDVLLTQILSDGSLDAWTPAGDLPISLSVSAAQLYGCSIYMFGGLTDGSQALPYTDRILRSSIATDGTLAATTVIAPKLSIARGHVHQTPVYKNFIYSVAGRQADQTAIGTIDIGTFQP